MSDLAIYDFEWIRGTTMPFMVSLKINGVPIPADDVRLSVYNGNTLAFRLSSADNPGTVPGTVSNSGGDYSFYPTEAQTRLLKEVERGTPGKSKYEVAVRNGSDEKVYLMGTIAGIGGINDDEAVTS